MNRTTRYGLDSPRDPDLLDAAGLDDELDFDIDVGFDSDDELSDRTTLEQELGQEWRSARGRPEDR
jgi:hypothetical protein